MKKNKIFNIIKLTMISTLFISLWILDLLISLINKESMKNIWKLETSTFEPIEDSNGEIIGFRLVKLGEDSLKDTLINLKNKYLI